MTQQVTQLIQNQLVNQLYLELRFNESTPFENRFKCLISELAYT